MLVEDIEHGELSGYMGKVLRIDLSDQSVEAIDITGYLPEYMGGRMLATRLYLDEHVGKVPALSPENTVVYMTGAGCGTGLPASGRGVFVSICPQGTEQFTYSGMGGMFGAELKYAGYDGLIVVGKAPRHTYVLVEDSEVTFHDADEAGVWGEYTTDAIDKLRQLHGDRVQSMVIGPAGENLVRFASITNTADAAAAKAGFGAIFGSKNLKGISVRGTGTVKPASAEAVLACRKNPSNPAYAENPLKLSEFKSPFGLSMGSGGPDASLEGVKESRQTNCQGCSFACSFSYFDVPDILAGDRRHAMVCKCLDTQFMDFTHDCLIMNGSFHKSKEQAALPEDKGKWRWFFPDVVDPTTEDGKWLQEAYPGDLSQYWTFNPALGLHIPWLCNQYGLDKWDINIGLLPWISAMWQEGILNELDMGIPMDERGPITVEWVSEFLRKVTYREGIGDVFAEGTGRAARILGKEKFAEPVYHNRLNAVTGEQLDIPVSLEACWGWVSHWLGRGFQGCHNYEWLIFAFSWMFGARDGSNSHFSNWVDEVEQFKDDPYHSELFRDVIVRELDRNEMKDLVTSCDFRSPNPTWPDLEADLYSAATGIPVTQDDLMEEAAKSRLLERSVLIRSFGRTRDIEVEAIFPWLTWPDPFGNRADWNDFNDLVDAVYQAKGFDLATGWPYRSTYEKYGLGWLADEMEAEGKLPPEGGTPGYVRKTWDRPAKNCPVPTSYLRDGAII